MHSITTSPRNPRRQGPRQADMPKIEDIMRFLPEENFAEIAPLTVDEIRERIRKTAAATSGRHAANTSARSGGNATASAPYFYGGGSGKSCSCERRRSTRRRLSAAATSRRRHAHNGPFSANITAYAVKSARRRSRSSSPSSPRHKRRTVNGIR